jgi:CheY-like chemotaxis protein
MQRQNVRVVLASEYPQSRYFLREIVEEEKGTIIVGQAENATKALTLARNLRPNVAIIDCYLPHVAGLDAIPLSRIGGLETAQTISQEIPNTRVILVTNLDTGYLSEHSWGPDIGAFLCRPSQGACIPFTLHELHQEAVPPGTLLFANVEVKRQGALRQKVSNMSDKAVLFGGLSILGGLSLMLTMILASAGVFLALLGAATMLLGLMGKLITLRRHKAG